MNSNLWFLENLDPTFFVERSGDACDSYHRYREDIAFLAGIGLTCYRFSVEWARIEPSRGHFSRAALDHYQRMIECCHDHGVAPAVAMFHGVRPGGSRRPDGWLNPEAPELFARYCAAGAAALGDGMAYAYTINEPQVGQVFRCIPGAESYFSGQDTLARGPRQHGRDARIRAVRDHGPPGDRSHDAAAALGPREGLRRHEGGARQPARGRHALRHRLPAGRRGWPLRADP